MDKKEALLLRRAGLGWRVIDGATGMTLVEFSQAECGRMWLDRRGYDHTDDTAGESRAEVWTKAVGR